jgi:hypothetical protein
MQVVGSDHIVTISIVAENLAPRNSWRQGIVDNPLPNRYPHNLVISY